MLLPLRNGRRLQAPDGQARSASCSEFILEDGLRIVAVGVASAVSRKALERANLRICLKGAGPHGLDRCWPPRALVNEGGSLKCYQWCTTMERGSTHPVVHMGRVRLMLLEALITLGSASEEELEKVGALRRCPMPFTFPLNLTFRV